jgi:hypothetical protein
MKSSKNNGKKKTTPKKPKNLTPKSSVQRKNSWGKRKRDEDEELRQPSVKRNKTSQDYGGDVNLQRALPRTYTCNGQIVENSAPHGGIVCDDVEYTIPFFSGYYADRNGELRSKLTDALVWTIEKHGKGKTVLGCVAWLSNERVLEALSKCRRVIIIVNREEYSTWGGGMLEKYARIPKFDEPLWKAFEHLGTGMSTLETHRKAGKSQYNSVRAFGNPAFKNDGSPSSATGAFARKREGLEHCKYLIFFDRECYIQDDSDVDVPESYVYKDTPTAVWTGSMNMTKASESHHENSVFTKSKKMAMQFWNDWAETFFSSTSLKCKNKKQTPKETKTSLYRKKSFSNK